ncbi:MAG TPA: CPBP family intramembrane metalloprotease [Pirellulaceae bacterium]|nr:CPBP family intramembrane metalloprotease [Pirellulaceae bacterium]
MISWFEAVLLLLSIASAMLWIHRGVGIWPDVPTNRDQPPIGTTASHWSLIPQWVPFGLVDCLVVFLAWVSIGSVLVSVFVGAFGDNPASIHFGLTIASLVVVLGASWIFLFAYPTSRSWLIETGQPISKLLADGIRRCVMILPPLLLVHRVFSDWVPYEHKTLSALSAHRDALTIVALWLSAVVAAPIYEEFFFRGVLLHWFGHVQQMWRVGVLPIVWGAWGYRRASAATAPPPSLIGSPGADTANAGTTSAAKQEVGNVWFPVLASSAIFGAMHWQHGLAAVPLFGLGVFLAVLALKTKSCWPPILVHALFNGYSMAWETLRVVLGGDT